MHRKATLISSFFAFFCCLFFIGSMFVNRSYFEAIAYDSVFSYELRQLAAIIVLFGIGLLFLLAVCHTLSPVWTVLFAFPTGICVWVFPSLFLLLVGIPYTLLNTAALLAVLLAALFALSFVRSKKLCQNKWSPKDQAPFLLLFLGLAFLAASGFAYSFVSYDSYFYFINYGHTLTIVQNFKDIVGENSFTLTNISQFLPLLHSYTAFWGLDQAFQMQAYLTFDIAVCFFYGLYQYILLPQHEAAEYSGPAVSYSKKRALQISALFTLVLVSSTSFIIVSTWVLANMYCMAYIFLLFLASFLASHMGHEKRDPVILIGLCFAALTMLRKDGIIFSAFFLICFASIELFSKKQLALMFLPATLAEIWWLLYVRIILDAGVTQGVFSSITNNKNIFFIALVICGSYFYLFAGHGILKWLEGKVPFLTEYYAIFGGMFLLLLYSFYMKRDIIIDNVDFVIRNMFRYPSSWGISGFAFGVLIVYSVVTKFRLDYLHFFWTGYSFLTFISYCIVESKNFWLNWDDSYNRVLLQIVPVFVFITAAKSLALLRSDTPDRSSGS